MTSRPLLLFACLSLWGCPSPSEAQADGWAEVGQRWRFVQDGLPDSEQVYQVTAVTAAEVRYTVQARVAGEDVGEPVQTHFPRSPIPSWGTPGDDEATLTISGQALPCRVHDDESGRTWTTGRAGPEFPGVIRATDVDGHVILELVEVAPPAED